MQYLKQKLSNIWSSIYTFFKSYEILFINSFTIHVGIIIFFNISIIWPFISKICFFISTLWPYISNFIEWLKSVYSYVIAIIILIFIGVVVYWWSQFILTKLKCKSNTGNYVNSIFLDDEPINSFEQDILNRTQFIKTLSKNIISIRNTECLVISINGRWGSGKSSTLNLLIKELKQNIKDTDTKHILVRFNPWNFSTIDQLIYMFFNEIKINIGKKDKEFEKIIGNKIEAIGEILTPLSLFPVLGVFPQYTKNVGKGIAKLARDKSLLDLKREINDYLKSNNKTIIILVDDIDRMDADSMKLLFRLIRLNADFFNTIYVLAFDRTIVENVLKNEYGVTGHEYLEKIIQVSVDLPSPESSRVEDILFKEINNILSDELEKDFNELRFFNLYYAGLKNFFKTIRDVKRYINAFRLTYPLVKEEVNLIDFINLQALRVFCPEFYKNLSKNKELFIYPIGKYNVSQEVIENQKIQIKELIAKAEEDYKYDLKGICKKLFPQVSCCYNEVYTGNDSQFRFGKEKLICNEEYFDKYFLFGIPKGEISEIELNRILKNSISREEFLNNLQDLKKRNLIIKFFDRLRDYIYEIPEIYINDLIGAIFDFSDELNYERHVSDSIHLEGQLYLIIVKLLKRIPDWIYSQSIKEQKPILIKAITSIEPNFGICSSIFFECILINSINLRNAMIKKLINTSKGLYLLIYVLSELNPKKERGKIFNITENDFEEIKHLLITKINEYVQNDKLQNTPNLLYILYYWSELAGIEETKKYVDKLISTEKGFVTFLTSCLQQNHCWGIGDYVAKKTCHIDSNAIEKYTNKKEFLEKVKKFEKENIDNLKEKERLAVDIFLKEIGRKM